MSATALILAAALASATAQDTAPAGGWVQLEGAKIPAIYPADQGRGGPLLTCRDGRYGLSIGLETTDFATLLSDLSPRARSMSGRLIIDGADEYEGPFSYRPNVKVAQTSERKAAAKVFNAVVQGQSVTFELRGKATVDLELPEVDDTFRAFASECQAQRNA